MARHAPIHQTCANPDCDNPIEGGEEETVMDGRFYCCPECAQASLEVECGRLGCDENAADSGWVIDGQEYCSLECAQAAMLEVEYGQPEVCAAGGEIPGGWLECAHCGGECTGFLTDEDTGEYVCGDCYPLDPTEADNWDLCEPSESAYDEVNHPAHYTQHPSGIECIQITEHMNFCIGNAIKYLWRANLKDEPIKNMEKARWYITREIERLRGE